MKKIIFTRNSSKPIPRITRMMDVAVERGLKPIFVGAKRNKDDKCKEDWNGFEILRVGNYYPSLNGKGIITLIKGLFYLNLGIYKELKISSAEIVHASDYETIIPALIYKLLYGKKVIYNIHDNLHQRYNINKMLSIVLKFVESVFIYFSDVTLVPEEFRKEAYYCFARKKISVIKNTPNTELFEYTDDDKVSRSKPIVFYAGWIDRGRGISELMEMASSGLFTVKIAGDGDIELLEKIKLNKNIEYLGYLNHKDILKETSRSDFIFALYKPDRVINRYAASNKIAESLFIGKPVIVNDEMEISKILKQNNCCISFEYDRISYSYKLILDVFYSEVDYKNMSDACKKLYKESYSWEEIKKNIEIIYTGIGY